MSQHKKVKVTNSYQIKYNKLINSIKSIVWYNGHTGHIKKMIKELENDDFSASDYCWTDPIVCTNLVEVHFIAMMIVLMFGDYDTSPRSGWISDEQAIKDAIAFLEDLIKED